MFIKSYSEFVCIIPMFINPSSAAENNSSKIWSASFKLDQNLSPLFPYINATLDDAIYYANPEHIYLLFNGYPCFLYPGLTAAHFFESKNTAKDFIVSLIDLLNDIHQQKDLIRPNYDQVKQVHIIDILKILPRTNCRKCGYLSCMAFAAGIIKSKVSADKCPGLVSPIRQDAVYPVFDTDGKVIDSVSLQVNKSKAKNQIQERHERICEISKLKTDNPNEDKRDCNLTVRELEVLKLIARGYTNNEISGVLFISPHTVKSHMINIFNKFNVNDRTQAAVLATQKGII